MAFTEEQKRVLAFYENIGIELKGSLINIKSGPIVDNFIYKPNGTFSLAKAIIVAQKYEATVSQNRDGIVTFQIPKEMRQMIFLDKLLESEEFKNSKATLPIILGTDTLGNVMTGDLRRMPHLLISGRTGTGKSVFMQSIVTSLIQRFTPDECRLLLIDPKGIDFDAWDKEPHLITPVIQSDTVAAINALNWVVCEIKYRFDQFQALKVRGGIGEYNEVAAKKRAKGQKVTYKTAVGTDAKTGKTLYEERNMDLSDMPYIVVVIDEIADLICADREKVEMYIQKIAQLSRLAGIHMIMATQRSSSDVITGVIKANFPSRMSFQMRSAADSMAGFGDKGAELLLPYGDMLFSDGGHMPVRIHTPYVSDTEITKIVKSLRKKYKTKYISGVTEQSKMCFEYVPKYSDKELYQRAKEIVIRDNNPRISYIQRRLSIGYNKAATLIEKMERDGIVSAEDENGKRRVL
ncbi:MAG: DUF87 domain-containing protein [Alphaproteobacteria bacterium]|nr:DUF87 domain-containing protein [Alphaproteobacteria bacterium]